MNPAHYIALYKCPIYFTYLFKEHTLETHFDIPAVDILSAIQKGAARGNAATRYTVNV